MDVQKLFGRPKKNDVQKLFWTSKKTLDVQKYLLDVQKKNLDVQILFGMSKELFGRQKTFLNVQKKMDVQFFFGRPVNCMCDIDHVLETTTPKRH